MISTETRRQPILEAMIRIAGRKGYRATTVADVVEEADASSAAFYEYFDDKQDCFLLAYDLVVKRLVREVIAACKDEEDWLDRVRAGLSTVVELFALDPELARTAVVEVQAAGAAARRRHLNALDRIAAFLEDGRQAAGDRELPENVAPMAAGAVSGLLFDELLMGRAERLPKLLPELLFVLLVPYIGTGAAAEAMRRAAAG